MNRCLYYFPINHTCIEIKSSERKEFFLLSVDVTWTSFAPAIVWRDFIDNFRCASLTTEEFGWGIQFVPHEIGCTSPRAALFIASFDTSDRPSSHIDPISLSSIASFISRFVSISCVLRTSIIKIAISKFNKYYLVLYLKKAFTFININNLFLVHSVYDFITTRAFRILFDVSLT